MFVQGHLIPGQARKFQDGLHFHVSTPGVEWKPLDPLPAEEAFHELERLARKTPSRVAAMTGSPPLPGMVPPPPTPFPHTQYWKARETVC